MLQFEPHFLSLNRLLVLILYFNLSQKSSTFSCVSIAACTPMLTRHNRSMLADQAQIGLGSTHQTSSFSYSQTATTIARLAVFVKFSIDAECVKFFLLEFNGKCKRLLSESRIDAEDTDERGKHEINWVHNLQPVQGFSLPF